MANTNKFVVKNGLQSQNVDFVSPDGANTITLSISDGDILSISGNAGQLFSITDSFSGTIFSANDVSGIPSIEVLDTGLVKLAQYSSNVLIGTGTDNSIDKLQVNGSITGSVLKSSVDVGTAPLTVTSTTLVTNLNADLLDGQQGSYYTSASNITSGTLPGDRGVTAGSTSSSFVEYNGTTKTAGQLYGGTSDPTNTTRLNYDGYLYATRFYGDGSQLTGISLPSGQTAGSSTSGYLQYAGTTKTAGQLDGGAVDPTNTTRLNYDGYLYATRFYGDGSNLTGLSINAAGYAIAMALILS